jgi:hypothetical protein
MLDGAQNWAPGAARRGATAEGLAGVRRLAATWAGRPVGRLGRNTARLSSFRRENLAIVQRYASNFANLWVK